MRKHQTLEAALDIARGWSTVKGRPGGRLTRRTDQGWHDESSPEGRELLGELARKIACLSERERKAIEAYAGASEDSCRNLARRLGVSPQTICNWAKVAIVKLRSQLKDCL